MKSNRCIFVVLALLCAGSALAMNSKTYLSFEAGPSWEYFGANPLVYMNDINNLYTYSPNSRSGFEWGAHIGQRFTLSPRFLLDAGIGAYLGNYKGITGTLEYFSDPQYENMRFAHDLNSTRFMFEPKLSYVLFKNWLPYVEAGIGVAYNRLSGYHETPISDDGSAIPADPFAGNTTDSFAYQFGAGLSYQCNEQMGVTIGYRYANLGRASFGLNPEQDPSQYLNTYFSTKNLSTQTAFVALNFYF